MAFEGIPKEGYGFLLDLRFNNNRQWFNDHKHTYIACLKNPLYALASAMAPAVAAVDGAIDLRPEHVVSRIYRDARRARGRDFYRDVIWFSFKRPAEEENIGRRFSLYYYLNPEEYGWGCGFYDANPAQMESIRKRIAAQRDAFYKIITAPGIAGYALSGEDYKKPKGDMGDPLINAYYNKKRFSVGKDFPVDGQAYSPALLDRLNGAVSEMRDIYRFSMGMDI